METTEIIRILRQCGTCCLTDCTECPEYHRSDSSEGQGFMWSCGGVLLEAADRLEKLSQNKSIDLISRSALIEEIERLCGNWHHGYQDAINHALEEVRAAPAVDSIPVEVVRNYLVSLVDEWHNMGDRAYELPNIQVYNHVRKCLDDLEDYCEGRNQNG